MRIGLVASVTLKKISAYSFIVSISMVDSLLFRYRFLYSQLKVHQPRSLLLLIERSTVVLMFVVVLLYHNISVEFGSTADVAKVASAST